MSITDTYKSLRETQKSWAVHVARSVHEFYADVLEHLSTEYEDWYMDSYWNERAPLTVALHLYALDELEKARRHSNHPTMQLHEMIAANDIEAFSEAFKDFWDLHSAERTFDDRVHQTIRKNSFDEHEEDYDVLVSRVLDERFPTWPSMDSERFLEAWKEALAIQEAKTANHRVTWS
jgi:hypothetical protein